MKASELITKIKKGEFFNRLYDIYGEDATRQSSRYIKTIEEFCKQYGEDRHITLFSVPGRSEICGNHTDHNHGKVMAAGVNLDIIAVASKNTEDIIRIKSEGYDEDCVNFSEYKNTDKNYYYKSKSLIAGMAAGFEKEGYSTGGFDAYTTTEVYKGSGLSSSAAFEVMVGNIINHFYNEGKVTALDIAKIAQYSENEFFGKPCGLMDQTACAVGGFVEIDFETPSNPLLIGHDFNLDEAGYSLCIINTGGNHADLNEDYASVPAEMKAVAEYFGKSVLREISWESLIENIPALRKTVGDRAIMRAYHYFAENKRVTEAAKALKTGNISLFLSKISESGNSSFKYLQNVYTVKNVAEQGLSLALCLTEDFLSSREGAYRVHGGGFAGTIQAFIKKEDVERYKERIDAAFGKGACAVLNVRKYGAIKVI
ncbi:MAG: galactokinase [Clostridiales bacterium]|nr:galactokinase [Clostridiales bacterium]